MGLIFLCGELRPEQRLNMAYASPSRGPSSRRVHAVSGHVFVLENFGENVDAGISFLNLPDQIC